VILGSLPDGPTVL